MYDENDNPSRQGDWQTQRMDETVEVTSRQVGGDDFDTVTLDTPVPERRRGFVRDTPLDTEVVRVRRDDEFAEEEGRQEPPFDLGDDLEGAREDFDGDDGDGDAEEADAVQEPRRERFKLIKQIFLGTILNSDHIRENYRYAVLIAGMLFLSIVMLFTSLSVYIRYTTLENEVRLLRERAIRMSELRYEQSSHSAVVRRLQERGIELKDPSEPRLRFDR